MQRVLKSTALEQSPGDDISIDIRDSDIDAESDRDLSTTKMAALPASEIRKLIQPLRVNLAAQKRDAHFRARFRLPATEQLLHTVNATNVAYEPAEGQKEQEGGGEKTITTFPGRLHLSQAFLTFESTDKNQLYEAVMPLYTIRRVERLNEKGHAFAVKFVNWHQGQTQFYLNV